MVCLIVNGWSVNREIRGPMSDLRGIWPSTPCAGIIRGLTTPNKTSPTCHARRFGRTRCQAWLSGVEECSQNFTQVPVCVGQ